MKKEWFVNWFDSPYYPILYNHRNWEEAGKFVDNIFNKLAIPPHQKVLDIACGEGRFAAQMASKKHEVVGIDLSASRIEKAKELLRNDLNLKFQIHDMRMPYYNAYFDYAFNFFTSFGYFKNERDTKAAARSFMQCLKPGGVLLIDFLNAPKVIDELVPYEEIQKEEMVFKITKRMEQKTIVKSIEVVDPALEESLFFEERVSALHLEDFKELFVQGLGMELVAAYGDYELNEYDSTSSHRLIMKFRK